MSLPKVLYADADAVRACLLSAALRAQGLSVSWRQDTGSSECLVEQEGCDVALVGEVVDGCASGLEFAHRFRAQRPRLGIVAMQQTWSAAEAQRALDDACDDCVAAACAPEELAARLRAVARRCSDPEAGVLRRGAVTVDLFGGCVRVAEREVALPPLQLRILGFLMLNAGRVVTREELSRRIFRVAHGPNSTSVARQISALRAELGPLRDIVMTVAGGYSIGDAPSAP